MSQKKTNKILIIRSCLITNQKKERKDLIRLVASDKNLIIDKDNKIKGRGYYIQKNIQYNPNFSSILARKTKCNITNDFIQQLQKLLITKE